MQFKVNPDPTLTNLCVPKCTEAADQYLSAATEVSFPGILFLQLSMSPFNSYFQGEGWAGGEACNERRERAEITKK